MRLVPGAVLCLALLTVPAAAQAAQRYAAGKYRLAGRTGNTSKTAGFKIVR